MPAEPSDLFSVVGGIGPRRAAKAAATPYRREARPPTPPAAKPAPAPATPAPAPVSTGLDLTTRHCVDCGSLEAWFGVGASQRFNKPGRWFCGPCHRERFKR